MKKIITLCFLMALVCVKGLGQSTANYTFATIASGSLIVDANGNAVNMSTGTTALVAASSDEVSSLVTNIGFDFYLNGRRYTQFSASSNGVIALGATAPITSKYTITGGTTTTPYLGGLTADMITAISTDGGGVTSKIVGTAPNRCLVIQWVDYLYWQNISPAATWQVRLYESGRVEYVYGSMVEGSSTYSSGYQTGFTTNSTTSGTLVSVTTSTNTNSTTTVATNSYAAAVAIPNLSSTADGSRRIYSWTPVSTTTPMGINFTGVTGSSMNVNWTDNASDEFGYAIYRSTDNINFTWLATTSANATTYAATALSFGTTYYWKIYAVREALGTALAGSQATPAGSLSGTKTVGTGGDYPNLTTAFAAINTSGLSNNIDLQLIAGYPAIAETYPIASSNAAAVGSFNVKVYPTVSGLSITSANTTGTLNLNNAKNITFDGRVNQTGVKNLIIANTATAGYAVQLINDATANTIKYCTINGVNTSTTSGTIVFSTAATGTTGNDNNIIDNCDILDGATTPVNAIYSAGTSASVDNSGNTLSNNNIANYFGVATASNGIYLASNSSAWTITTNRFYQNATRTATTGTINRAIQIVTANGGGYTITGNTIGYASSTATGITTYTGSSSRFSAIELTAATSPASSIQGNTVAGISVTTTSGATTTPGIFSGITVLAGSVNIGTTTANTIGSNTGNGSISLNTSTSLGAAWGIYATSTGTVNIQNNIIGSINLTGSTAAVGVAFYGINTAGSGGIVTVSSNTIGSSATTNSIALGTTAFTTATTSFYGIYNTATGTPLNITGNSVYNIRNYSTGTSSFLYGIYNTGSATTANITGNFVNGNNNVAGIFYGIYNLGSGSGTYTLSNNNVFSNTHGGISTSYMIYGGSPTTLVMNTNNVYSNSMTGAYGTLYCMAAGSTSYTVNGNNIYSNSFAANSGSTSYCTLYGFYDGSSPTSETFNNNSVHDLTIAGSNSYTTSNHLLAGIYTNTAAGTKTWTGNTIYNLTFTNSGTGSGSVFGIATALSSPTISKNKIYGLAATNGASSIADGINIVSGTTVTLSNNIIGGITAPASGNVAAPAVTGIYITTATAVNVYYNTIYLTGSSTGTNFGTAAIYANTTPTLTLANNIFVNNTTPSGTGKAAVYQRSSTTLTTYSNSSNNNNFYASNAAAVIYYDGTTSYASFPAYKTAMATRDQASFTENPTFVSSTTGSDPTYLHINITVGTQLESGGTPITGISDDFDGDTRNATTPDVGADEFAGKPAAVVAVTSVSINPTGSQCTPTARTVTATVTSGATAITSVVLNYSLNGGTAIPVTMTLVSGSASTGTSTWTGGIPASSNSVVTWSVTATDATTSKTQTGASYQDAPLTGITVTAAASPNPVCSGSPFNLTASANSTTTLLLEGFEGSTFPPSGWTLINAGSGNQWASSSTAHNGTKAMAYNYNSSFAANAWSMTPGQTLVAGQTYTVGFWYKTASSSGTFPERLKVTVGTSATVAAQTTIIWNNGGASSLTVETYTQATATFTPTVGGTYYFGFNCYSLADENVLYVDDISIIGSSQFTYAWTSTPAGFTSNVQNPIGVTTTANTTYNVTATDPNSTCTISNSIAVAVNPLPTVPTATNSTQCGNGVPGASVGDPNGYTTPTFKWYSAATGGTLLQSSTSTTYTSSVSTTTIFYVSVTNPSTGCESGRTAVTASVNQPDAVTAKANNSTTPAAVCLNSGAIALTVTQTGTTNNYSYTWSVTSGNAATAGLTNANQATASAQPTAAGTYTFQVAAADGSCNTSSSVSILINALPNITSATATPAAICIGSSSILTAKTATIAAGTAGVGAGATTEFTTSPYRNGANAAKQQYLFTASELTSAGFFSGNITALKFNVTSIGSPTALSNYTIQIGNTTSTSLGTTFESSAAFTTVYSAGTYTVVTGDNTHTFSTPFFWNGTSNIVVQVCHETTSPSTSCTVKADAVTGGSTGNTSFSVGSICSTTSAVTSANRPWIQFTGQIGTQNSGTYNWVWNPGSLSGATVTVTPTATTNYTVTATDPATGCVNSSIPVTVTVNQLPTAPTTSNSTQCGPGVPTASASDPNGYTTPTFKWYSAATGGTALQSSTSTSYTTSVSATTTFYVSVTNPSTGCESGRTAVTITVNTPDGVTASASPATLCLGGSSTLTAVKGSGTNVYTYAWMATSSNASTAGISTNTGSSISVIPTAAGIYTYQVSANDAGSGCSTTATVNLTIGTPLSTLTVTPAITAVCAGATDLLTATGGTVSGTATALSENFDNNAPNWTITSASTNSSNATITSVNWYYQPAPYTDVSGSATFSNFSTTQGGKFAYSTPDIGGSGSTTNTVLTSPAFSLANYTSATLTFEQVYRSWSADQTVKLQISTDGGLNWADLQNYLGTSVGTTTSNAQTTANTSVDLSSYLGNSNLKIRFNYVSVWGYYWIIDNILISGQQPTQVNITWSSPTNTDLFANAAGTTAYVQGTASSTVYAKPATSPVTYTATATSTTGCTTTATTSLSINPATTITNQPVGTTYCQNATATALTVSATGTGTLSYQWYSNATNSNSGGTSVGTANGGQTASYTPPTNVAGTKYYYVIVTASTCGSTATSNAVAVTITAPPAITTQPSSATQILCQGSAASLSVVATGTNLTYQWYSNTANSNSGGTSAGSANGGQTSTYTPTVVPGTTYYYVIVSGDCGIATSNPSGAIVSTSTQITSQPAATTTYCQNNTATALSVSTSGSNIDYQWYSNTSNSTTGGTAITVNGTNRTYVPLTNMAGTFYYYVIVTGDCGSATSTVATVNINALPTASFGSTGPFSTCYGTSVSIPVNGTANSTLTYQVDGSGSFTTTIGTGGTGSITTSSSLGSSSTTTSHTVTLTSISNSATGCSSAISGTANVTVFATPTVTLTTGSQNPSVCKNNSFSSTFTLGGSATGATVTVTPGINVTSSVSGSTVTITGTPSASGTYTITTTGSGGSCSATLSGTITLQSYLTWTGTQNANWSNANNWCSNTIPSATDDVVIAAGTPNNPALPADITVKSLTINSGATVDNNGHTLTADNVTGSGSITGSATSNLVVNNTSTLNFTTGFNILKNLTINGGTITLGNDLNITAGASYGIVTVANGAILATGGHLTLKSDINGTAAVAANTSATAYITGNVTAERYIPLTTQNGGRTGRAWRMLTAPVTGTTIGASWQENMLYDGAAFHTIGTSNTVTPPSHYGTMITGYAQGTAATANGNGYDFWSTIANSSSSIRSFQFASGTTTTGSWLSLSSISGKEISDEKAYMLFVRGDRSTTSGADFTTLRATGILKQLAQSVSIDRTKNFLVAGNPFPSTIDWNSIYQRNKSFIQDKFVVWNSKLSTYGAYVLVQGNGSGIYSAVPLNIAGNTVTDPTVRFIPSGAGFFVYPQTGGSGTTTLSITEADKNAGQVPPAEPFRLTPETDKKLWVNLNLRDSDTSAILADGVMARFDASYTAAVDGDDALKVTNFNENLGINSADSSLMVEARPDVQKTDTLHLKLWNVTQRNYQLQMLAANWGAGNGVHAYLEDSYLGTKQEVSLSGEVTTVGFSVTGDATSYAPDRFRIVFQNDAVVLPVTLTKLKAAPVNGGVNVTWTVTNEVNMKGYTVERSTDGGQTYSAVATQVAKNTTGAAFTDYQTFDAAPHAGDNLYRIRIEAGNGAVTYSAVVKVTFGTYHDIQITLYPNPVRSNGKVNLQLSYLVAGNYLVSVYSEAGQTVYQRKVTIAQPNTTQSEELKLGSGLAQGSYQVRITDSKGATLYTDKLVVSR